MKLNGKDLPDCSNEEVTAEYASLVTRRTAYELRIEQAQNRPRVKAIFDKNPPVINPAFAAWEATIKAEMEKRGIVL